jgi:hypothetical protein
MASGTNLQRRCHQWNNLVYQRLASAGVISHPRDEGDCGCDILFQCSELYRNIRRLRKAMNYFTDRLVQDGILTKTPTWEVPMVQPTVPVSDPIMANIVVTIFCGAIVMVYAARRYDTPESNRLTTTKSLFLMTGAGYLATSLILFLMLCEIVLTPGFLGFLGVSEAQNVVAKYASPPVLAAVILTTLLPNVAVLRTADEWFLKRFQLWGRIPHGVRNSAEKMSMEVLPIRQQHVDALKAWIAQDGDVPNELAGRIGSASESTSSGCLTRVLHLYRELEILDRAQTYASAFRPHADAWHAIRDDFRVFTAQSHAFFVFFDQLKTVDGTAGANALKQAGERYRDDICRKLFRQMAEFLAALLMVEASECRIRSRLATMGFIIHDLPCPQLPVGAFIFMGVIMMLAILGVVAVVRPHSPSMPLVVIALLIGLTKTIGILAAILPKVRWSWFRSDHGGWHPYMAWVVSAVAAVVVSFFVERLAFAILDHKLPSAFDFARFPLTPLAPTTFTLCLAIAILCDVDLRLGAGWLRRISEGMLCGATMVTTIFVCLRLLDIPSTTAGQTAAWFPFVFSFLIGFACGLVAPHVYRHARSDHPSDDDRRHRQPALRQQADPCAQDDAPPRASLPLGPCNPKVR